MPELKIFFAIPIIIILNVAVYWRTLKFHFCVDDVKNAKAITGGWFNSSKFTYNKILIFLKKRFYGCGTLAKKYKCSCIDDSKIHPEPKKDCKKCSGKGYFWNWSIKQDHALTMFMHTLASVLIYFAFGSNFVSFLAALLYSVNPINNQTSIWLNGRRYLMNVIVVLIMMITPYGLLLFPITGLYHVTAIFTPILCGWTGLIAMVLCGLILIRFSNIKKVIKNRIDDMQCPERFVLHPRRLIMIVKFYGHFFFKMIWPGTTLMVYPGDYCNWGQTVEGNKIAYSLSFEFWRGCIAVALTAVMPFFIQPEHFKYWVVMVLSTLQWCAIFPITQDLADRYASIPTIFMSFFVAYLFPYAVPFLVGAYIAQLSITMRMYPSIWAYWEYQCYFAGHLERPRSFKINYLIQINQLSTAWEEVKIGLKKCPKNYTFLKQSAVLCNGCGRFEEAKTFIEVAKNKAVLIGREEDCKKELNEILDKINNDQITWENAIKKANKEVERDLINKHKKKK